MRAKLTIIVFLLAALCVSPCLAWGPEGHRIIGVIAAQRLSDSAKAAVKELLGDQTLADVANWADEIRKDPAFDWAKPLHYINVPRGATKIDLKRDCAEDKCVIAAINKYAGILRDRAAPRHQRIEALKFLVHFVGDIHQPLHVSFADDRGGNDVKVTWLGQPDWNLHSVWDTGLIEHRIAGDREALIKAIRNNVITDRAVGRWNRSLDPVDWANESLSITHKLYKQMPRKPDLGEDYYKGNINRVEERLGAAGGRLAALLNDIFAEKSAAPSPVKPQ